MSALSHRLGASPSPPPVVGRSVIRRRSRSGPSAPHSPRPLASIWAVGSFPSLPARPPQLKSAAPTLGAVLASPFCRHLYCGRPPLSPRVTKKKQLSVGAPARGAAHTPLHLAVSGRLPCHLLILIYFPTWSKAAHPSTTRPVPGVSLTPRRRAFILLHRSLQLVLCATPAGATMHATPPHSGCYQGGASSRSPPFLSWPACIFFLGPFLSCPFHSPPASVLPHPPTFKFQFTYPPSTLPPLCNFRALRPHLFHHAPPLISPSHGSSPSPPATAHTLIHPPR